ncbi:MAG TPA: hypothetical protein VIN58_06935 [Roseateles sp.]
MSSPETTPTSTEPARQFFGILRTARPATLPLVIAAAAATTERSDDEPDALPDGCGWYDSSFDFSKGLDVSEQHSDLGFQLCLLLC